jgi:hypothetical protein
VSTIYDIGMSRRGTDTPASYYGLSDLSRTGKLEILIRFEGVTEKVDLPKEMLGRIATFIWEDYGKEGKFDCASFVHFANGITYEFGRFIPEKWDFFDFDEPTLVSGDSVMTTKDSEHTDIAHFALYLSGGLYLSGFGEGGKLAATTMDEMKKAFPGEHVFRMRPKGRKRWERSKGGSGLKSGCGEIETEKSDLKREMEAVDAALKEIGNPDEPSEKRLELLMKNYTLMERTLSLLQEKMTLMRSEPVRLGVPIIRDADRGKKELLRE